MTTENRRKEEKPKRKRKDSRRNLVPLLNSAMVDKAEREESILPDNQRYIHIPKIEGVVSDYNIQEAIKAVTRNKGAPGIDGITTEEINGSCRNNGQRLNKIFLNGNIVQSPVRRVEIPKPDGSGVRKLGNSNSHG